MSWKREPKIYGPIATHGGRSPRWRVDWYERPGRRLRKNFTDELDARHFHEEKMLGHPVRRADLDLILKKVTEIKEFHAPGKIHELEAENEKLRRENSTLRGEREFN